MSVPNDNPMPNDNSIEQGPSLASTEPDCPLCDVSRHALDRFCRGCGNGLTTTVDTSPIGEESAPADAEPAVHEERLEAVGMNPLVPSVPSNAPESPVCDCGQELPISAAYCFMCGQKIGEVPERVTVARIGRGGSLVGEQSMGSDLWIGKDPDNTFVIDDDEFLSRRHVHITRDENLILLEDLDSSNGTFLRVRRPICLEAGDEILLGKTLLRINRS